MCCYGRNDPKISLNTNINVLSTKARELFRFYLFVLIVYYQRQNIGKFCKEHYIDKVALGVFPQFFFPARVPQLFSNPSTKS